jgi:hypothetical protein
VADPRRFPTFVDERGALTAIEFDDIPFPVRRVFVVHGADAALPRGEHGVPCEELVVLLSGSARFQVSSDDDVDRTTLLCDRRERLVLRPSEHVSYHLDGPMSAILVLASDSYRSAVESR